MTPLVGLTLCGSSLTPSDDLRPGTGSLGTPVWGPVELLRDLELRLGVPTPPDTDALRTMRFAARMRACVAQRPFYSASFEMDPLGTARAVLDLRDTLIESGWDGSAIVDGGPRLEAIAALEATTEPVLPMGRVDRLLAVVEELTVRPFRVYDALTLAEDAECWAALFRHVFRILKQEGTPVSTLEVGMPGAPAESDLGKVQAALLGESTRDVQLTGDGSFVLLTAETALEAGRAAAALLACERNETCVVIRDGNRAPLDGGLELQGLPTQGVASTSRWRAALALLPLSLELAFEPKDPYRVLELLTLPRGPFAGSVGRRMARALARAPGIGGQRWEAAKERLPEPRGEALSRIAEWLEVKGSDAIEGAPKANLLSVIERVRGWLGSRVAASPEDATLFAAIAHCDALVDALTADPRAKLTLVETRRLSEFVMGGGARLDVLPERSSRFAHVSSPSELLSSRETVLWWSFAGERDAPRRLPWRRRELSALTAAGVRFPDPDVLLAERGKACRRAVCAASRRLFLVVPRHDAGEALAPHPLWDEIVARLDLDAASRERVTARAKDLVREGVESNVDDGAVRSLTMPATEESTPLALPGGDAEWTVALPLRPGFAEYTASKLSKLLGCPLRWALSELVGIDSEGFALPSLANLSGNLGHRLIEELFLRGAFEGALAEFQVRAGEEVPGLIEREGAVLLRAGKANEREQVQRQLFDAAVSLKRLLDRHRWRIVAVEEAFERAWRGSRLTGRLDLLLEGDAGERFVIDMKWGKSTYVKALKNGEALQLATYVHALSSEPSEADTSGGGGRRIDAAFYSLKARRPLAPRGTSVSEAEEIDGPDLVDTWRRVERTVPLVEHRVSEGRFPVVGLERSLPLLTSLGVAETEQERYFAASVERSCEYCGFDGLCGRRWEQAT